ncbi:MAG: 16S rRNA (cytosine(1402)-N(4))-methyltransferase, partial [Proteobacteria bacterium]|nr:16S rRNA (cytosine(1402)-N(4))-methyltransferase [Pseudomonadota bacterium]
MEWLHKSVLLKEVIDFIVVFTGGVYADLTFGEGGHSEAFLARGAAAVWAFDRDLSAIQQYQEGGNLRGDPRLKLQHCRFSQFPERVGEEKFDGILIDLGVSTRQLISQERGFTFQKEGPLDMRMDQTEGPTLQELLSESSEEELADLIWNNTDFKGSRALSRKILHHFREGKIKTTLDLA